MPRPTSRQFKKAKPYIIVFCEGESEQAYADFLKKKFADFAVIKSVQLTSTAIFKEADIKFKKEPRYEW